MWRSPPRSSTHCCRTPPGLTWLIFLGVYVSSYTAGLAANLPGGIGVFDTAMLFGLSPYIDAPHIVGAIVVFRLYYYVIPLFLAGSLFAGNEILLRGGGLLRMSAGWRRCRRSAAGASRISPSPPPPARSALCGVLMLCLGVLAPQSGFFLARSGLRRTSPARPGNSCRR